MRLPWTTKTQILQDEVAFLRAQVAQLQNYLLMTGQLPAQPFPTFSAPQMGVPQPAQGPDENGMLPTPAAEVESWLNMAMSEPEEDIEWARQAGDISDARARELLAEIQRERQDEL